VCRDSVRIIGVEPRAAPTLTALRAGRPVDAPASGIAADALAPRRVGETGFPFAQAYVDRVILVDDEDITRAQRALWDNARLVAEPGGAGAFAALTSGAYRPGANERVAVISLRRKHGCREVRRVSASGTDEALHCRNKVNRAAATR
jgi:threonine dehydratase